MNLWRIAEDESTQQRTGDTWLEVDLGAREGSLLVDSECVALRRHEMAVLDNDPRLAYCERCGWSVEVEPPDE